MTFVTLLRTFDTSQKYPNRHMRHNHNPRYNLNVDYHRGPREDPLSRETEQEKTRHFMWNYRMQREYYRAQRRAYRRQMRGYYGGGFGGLVVLAIILISFSHLFWMIFPLVFFGIPFFFFVLRPLLFGALNQSPYNQQYQPYQQEQMYQQYQQQQPQEDPPAYQPYSQGYQPQQPASKPAEIYQESGQQYQYPEQQTQQYEDPLTMYPRE